MGPRARRLVQKYRNLESCAKTKVVKASEYVRSKCSKKSQKISEPQGKPVPPPTELVRPETYVPTGAPWRLDAANSDSNTDLVRGARKRASPPGCLEQLDTWVTSGEEWPCTEQDSRLILASNGNEGCLALLPDSDFLMYCRQAALDFRQFSRANKIYDAELRKYYEKLQELQTITRDLESRVAGAAASTCEPKQDSAETLEHELRRRREEMSQLDQRKRELDDSMNSDYGDLIHKQENLFGLIDAMLVQSKLLNPAQKPESSVQATGLASAASSNYDAVIPSDVSQMYTAYNQEATIRESMRSNGSRAASSAAESRVLKRKIGYSDMLHCSTVLGDRMPEIDDGRAKVRLDLYGQFRLACYRLDAAEADLEDRELHFERMVNERHRKRAAGEDIGTQLDFDLELFQETQRLTREVFEAEEAHEEAKTRAIVAGVQLEGSDISEYADDVNDGYRLSFEEGLMRSINPAGIYEWMNDIIESSSPEEAELEDTAALDWDIRSIGISDSPSMLARGPWRKRIDRWRAVCGSN